jgi:hypothetical protein
MSIIEEKFFKELNKQRLEDYENEKQRKFHNWLQKCDYNNINNNSKIKLFISKILLILKHKSYKIDNEKLFKDEIATLIYNLSVNEKS